MNTDTYWQILLASLAGALTGVVVMWNRKRSELTGANRGRQGVVLGVGTAASAYALVAFARAFGIHSSAYAVLTVLGLTGWVAVVNSAVDLPMPGWLTRVGAGEFALLRQRWTGVRSFGALLRHTPLRHLGGRVYLADGGGDPQVILEGIRAAQAVHFWALLAWCPWGGYYGVRGCWAAVIIGVAAHLPLNLYPLLHLRYASRRIEQCLTRRRPADDSS